MIEVELDGVMVDSPMGLNDLGERIYFDRELSMFINRLEGNITFVGDAYNILRDGFNSSVCNLIPIVISEPETGLTYTGTIFLNDITWNLSVREAECTIVSDDFIRSINNNRGIKVQLGVGLAKDRSSIYSQQQTNITLPDPPGVLSVNRYGFRIYDVFRELVEFMTNGQLSFVSDYFNPSGGNEQAAHSVIMTGQEVREGTHDQTPLISFDEFFSDINRLFNIAGVIEGGQLRIEPKLFFRQTVNSIDLNDVNSIRQTLNREQFYASVKFGSAKVADGYGYLIRLSYNGFQREQFFLEGDCNINNHLNLQLRTFITDTNIIQDIQPVANGGTDNSDYDDDIVIIACNSTNTAYVTVSPLSTDYYYNHFYTNMMVSERWAETYPFSIIQLLETEAPLVRATLTANQTGPEIGYLKCDDDSTPPNFDTGGDYHVAPILVTPSFTIDIGYFEAPTDMIVTVDIDLHLTGFYFRTFIRHVDAFGEIMSSDIEIDLNPDSGFDGLYFQVNNRHIIGSGTFYMQSGSRVFCQVLILTSPDEAIYSGAKFEVVQLGIYGGVYKVVNDNNAHISRVSMEYPIDSGSWSELRDSPYAVISGNYSGGQFKGRLDDAKRNIATGESDITLYQRKFEVDG